MRIIIATALHWEPCWQSIIHLGVQPEVTPGFWLSLTILTLFVVQIKSRCIHPFKCNFFSIQTFKLFSNPEWCGIRLLSMGGSLRIHSSLEDTYVANDLMYTVDVRRPFSFKWYFKCTCLITEAKWGKPVEGRVGKSWHLVVIKTSRKIRFCNTVLEFYFFLSSKSRSAY